MIEKLVKLTKEQEELLSLIDKNNVPSHVSYHKSINELMKESKKNLTGINNLLEYFNLSEDMIYKFKGLVNSKSKIPLKKSDYGNDLVPINKGDNKSIAKIEVNLTPEHVHKYLSVLYKELKGHFDVVENNRRINPAYRDDTKPKLERNKWGGFIKESFNDSIGLLEVSYSSYYKKNISNDEIRINEKKSLNRKDSKILSRLLDNLNK